MSSFVTIYGMKTEIVHVKSASEIEQVAAIAGQVWREYYSSILTTGQIEYMLERFQSVEAVSEQIAKGGYQYYLLGNGDENFGYFAIKQEGESLFLSKYYMQKCYRGRGYASAGFDFIEKFAAGRALASVWLTVNKGNEKSISIYKHRGYVIVKEQVADIGNGFVMDDYIMEKRIETKL